VTSLFVVAGVLTAQIAPASISASGPGDVTFHGGPVMHTAKTYAIFWLPRGVHFEQPGHGSDRQFEELVTRFLRDVGGTPYYDVVTQYNDDLGQIRNSSRFGGMAVDTHPYPADTAAIGSEVLGVAARLGWRGGLSSLFLVFTASGAFNGPDEHSDADRNGVNYLFATVLHPYVCGACDASGVDRTAVATPNRDTTFDLTVPSLSHETFEAISDPLGVSWYDAGGADGGEIADKCSGATPSPGPDGGDVTLHGHRYVVAALWSNVQHACVVGYGPPEPPRTLRTVPPPAPGWGRHA
jgi:hypothetical protein